MHGQVTAHLTLDCARRYVQTPKTWPRCFRLLTIGLNYVILLASELAPAKAAHRRVSAIVSEKARSRKEVDSS